MEKEVMRPRSFASKGMNETRLKPKPLSRTESEASKSPLIEGK
jgi:hypothetical protein